jgi:hypothetical protein
VDLPISIAAKAIADLLSAKIPINFSRKDREAAEISRREEQLKLLQSLTEAGIDPLLFDLMLSTELDRGLKKQFGIAFFSATVVFTALSYAVIIFNSTLKWGITDIAITALIVETPIQFIGLLYIIARNLFPQSAVATRASLTAFERSHRDPDPSSPTGHRTSRRAATKAPAEPGAG